MFKRVKSLDTIVEAAERRPLHRSLGAFHLTMLGIGAIIGSGIFVLTAEAAQKAGPGMILSFVIAGIVCAVAALCYAEMASMIPVSGSAYTYSYAVLGEQIAWMVGWALILEYAVAASAVSVSWSGYVVGLISQVFDVTIPPQLVLGPLDGGWINLPALAIAGVMSGLLVLGTHESAIANAILVVVKMAALAVFLAFTIPAMHVTGFTPFMPTGMTGVSAGAASIFFAYVGFDAVSTAAEETKDPQRNMPIGLIGSLAVCTALYMLVAAGVIGTVGAQPVVSAGGEILQPGTAALTQRCSELAAQGVELLPCSKEALAWVLRRLGRPGVGNIIGLAAGVALPSVILMMIYGQTRIFFAMSRDGLLPKSFSRVHSKFKTPHVVTITTGGFVALFSALFPVGLLADISNSGTLFAFVAVCIAVMRLRRTDPARHRPFRTPMLGTVGPIAIIGCLYLFASLGTPTKLMFLLWSSLGLMIYMYYGKKMSNLSHCEE